jgi:hypothetical protein
MRMCLECNGEIRCGAARRDELRFGVDWWVLSRHGPGRKAGRDMARCGTHWHGVERPGLERRAVVRRGMVWKAPARTGKVWYGSGREAGMVWIAVLGEW